MIDGSTITIAEREYICGSGNGCFSYGMEGEKESIREQIIALLMGWA